MMLLMPLMLISDAFHFFSLIFFHAFRFHYAFDYFSISYRLRSSPPICLRRFLRLLRRYASRRRFISRSSPHLRFIDWWLLLPPFIFMMLPLHYFMLIEIFLLSFTLIISLFIFDIFHDYFLYCWLYLCHWFLLISDVYLITLSISFLLSFVLFADA